MVGVADADGHWTGGSTILVQTGDITDRGPDSRGVIDMIQKLQEEAPGQGGQVVALMGNHEAMNLMGDWRYVSEEDVKTYGGLEARKQAYSPAGEDGAWLRTLPAVALVGDTVFAHGGITERWAKEGIETINREVKLGLDARNEVHSPDGPLWYRGYVQDDEDLACMQLKRSLAMLGAKRMVVGHTTRKDGLIQARCEGLLSVIDTGISSHYGGHLAAWESLNGDARAIYPTKVSDIPDPSR